MKHHFAVKYFGILLILLGVWELAILWGWALPDGWFWGPPNAAGISGIAHWWSMPTLLSTLYLNSIFTVSGIFILSKS
jgi:hypothetical protein